ncbi:hypothetical protein B0H13DRAFT_1896998 [Mycena leptocephala]|nr:hypothetical protein B0H13DRAFT_1896998 [Mycena leptocephala]
MHRPCQCICAALVRVAGLVETFCGTNTTDLENGMEYAHPEDACNVQIWIEDATQKKGQENGGGMRGDGINEKIARIKDVMESAPAGRGREIQRRGRVICVQTAKNRTQGTQLAIYSSPILRDPGRVRIATLPRRSLGICGTGKESAVRSSPRNDSQGVRLQLVFMTNVEASGRHRVGYERLELPVR